VSDHNVADVTVYILALQVRDGVTNASEQAAAQCEAAVDDVTSHVTMTSRRLSDVADRAHSVSTLAQQQFSGSSLDAIATVNKPRSTLILRYKFWATVCMNNGKFESNSYM